MMIQTKTTVTITMIMRMKRPLSSENANDPALQQDACDVAIANCSRSLFQAESNVLTDLQGILSACL